MSDISETDAALLMLELKLQVMEIGLRSLNKIIEECVKSVDDIEQFVKENYGSDN
jgi:hypothetical protein